MTAVAVTCTKVVLMEKTEIHVSRVQYCVQRYDRFELRREAAPPSPGTSIECSPVVLHSQQPAMRHLAAEICSAKAGLELLMRLTKGQVSP